MEHFSQKIKMPSEIEEIIDCGKHLRIFLQDILYPYGNGNLKPVLKNGWSIEKNVHHIY